jgi:LPS export ABC transporter permease LptG
VTVLTRYLVAHYVRALLGCLALATTVMFLRELVDKLASLGAYDATAGAVTAHLVLKIPSIVVDAYPATALLAVLISLGLLARRGEMLAIRALGVSRWRVLAPLVVAALGVSLVMLAWCERVVPATSSRSRLIRDNVIKQRDTQGYHGVSSIWLQSTTGFVTADFYDADAATLYGLTVFETDADMRLRRIVQASTANWRDDAWQLVDASVKDIGPGATVTVRALAAGETVLTESPASFEKRRPKPKELTYRELGALIDTLAARGLPVEELRVDRQMKLAWPLSGVVTMLVGFPLAVRGGRRFGLGYNVAIGLVVGFAYWAVLAMCAAGGKTGALAPIVAAWAPNGVFAVIGCLLCMRRDV